MAHSNADGIGALARATRGCADHATPAAVVRVDIEVGLTSLAEIAVALSGVAFADYLAAAAIDAVFTGRAGLVALPAVVAIFVRISALAAADGLRTLSAARCRPIFRRAELTSFASRVTSAAMLGTRKGRFATIGCVSVAVAKAVATAVLADPVRANTRRVFSRRAIVA